MTLAISFLQNHQEYWKMELNLLCIWKRNIFRNHTRDKCKESAIILKIFSTIFLNYSVKSHWKLERDPVIARSAYSDLETDVNIKKKNYRGVDISAVLLATVLTKFTSGHCIWSANSCLLLALKKIHPKTWNSERSVIQPSSKVNQFIYTLVCNYSSLLPSCQKVLRTDTDNQHFKIW